MAVNVLRLLHPFVCLCAFGNTRTAKWIFMKFDVCKFYKNVHKAFSFYLDGRCFNYTLHEDLVAYLSAW